MKRYEKYKEVDLPWLKEVPSHWELKRLSMVFLLRKEKNTNFKTQEILSLSAKYGVSLYSEKKEKGGNKPKEDLSAYFLCYPGDILMNCMNVVAGSVGISNYFGAVSPVYYPLVNINEELYSTKYMEYIFRNYNFQRSLVGLGKGIQMSETDGGRLYTVRMRISWDMLKVQNLGIPPLQEQIQIANFLDWKISEIDRLIELEKNKIEKLWEYKKNKIFSLATYGINNDLIKTNVKWIEYLPRNWKLEKAKYLFNKEKRDIKESDEIITCFRDGTVTLRKNRRLEGFTESINEYGYQGIRKGDLVIHVMDAFAGAIGVSDADGKSTPLYNVCTSKLDLNNHYYKYLLRYMAYTGYIKSFYRGIRERSTNFTFDIFKEIILPIPSKAEQDNIVMECEQIEHKIDNLISKTNNQITYLEELKQTLISDVVTGKMDVRNIEIPDKYKMGK